MTEAVIIGVGSFLMGWLLRGTFDRLLNIGRLITFTKLAERSSLMMLGRASEHYHHSLHMLKDAGEVADKKNEVISTINSIEFTHKQWQRTAIQALYEAHPFKNTVEWYDWRTAMRTLENNKLLKRRGR